MVGRTDPAHLRAALAHDISTYEHKYHCIKSSISMEKSFFFTRSKAHALAIHTLKRQPSQIHLISRVQ